MDTSRILKSYQSVDRGLLEVVPKVLERAYASGRRILLWAKDESLARLLDDKLWTFAPDAFVPHGVAWGQSLSEQPVLISTTLTSANNPDAICFLDNSPDDIEEALLEIQKFDHNGKISILLHIFTGDDFDKTVGKAYEQGHDLKLAVERSVFQDGKWLRVELTNSVLQL